MDAQAQYEFMKLVVSWTLIGVFIFTSVAAILTLVGWVEFADKKQRDQLFYVILVELVTGCIGLFLGVLNPSPQRAKQAVEEPLKIENGSLKKDVEDAKREAEDARRQAEESKRKEEQSQRLLAAADKHADAVLSLNDLLEQQLQSSRDALLRSAWLVSSLKREVDMPSSHLQKTSEELNSVAGSLEGNLLNLQERRKALRNPRNP